MSATRPNWIERAVLGSLPYFVCRFWREVGCLLSGRAEGSRGSSAPPVDHGGVAMTAQAHVVLGAQTLGDRRGLEAGECAGENPNRCAIVSLPTRRGRNRSCRKPSLRSGLQDFCSRRAPRPLPPRLLCRPPRAVITSLNSDLTDVRWRRCWIDRWGQGAANGVGATAGAGFVAAEPFEAVAGFCYSASARTTAT